MRLGVRKRMEFIEARLYWEGRISRKDLVDFFEISIPQATKDIKEYSEKAPDNIRYDQSVKHYIATENFTPTVSTPSSEDYLTRLRLLPGKKDATKFFNSGSIPPFSEIPKFQRSVDKNVLKPLLRSIHDKQAVEVNYQSMSCPEPELRWITPHSLGCDGFRWHVRALCHRSSMYKDFNLGRILSITRTKNDKFDHSIDYEWNNEITIKIAPNKGLSPGQRACIERDYGMKDGEISLEIKAAFFYYFKKRFGFGVDHDKSPGNEQQIILLNHDEVSAKIDLLQSMSKKKIWQLRTA